MLISSCCFSYLGQKKLFSLNETFILEILYSIDPIKSRKLHLAPPKPLWGPFLSKSISPSFSYLYRANVFLTIFHATRTSLTTKGCLGIYYSLMNCLRGLKMSNILSILKKIHLFAHNLLFFGPYNIFLATQTLFLLSVTSNELIETKNVVVGSKIEPGRTKSDSRVRPDYFRVLKLIPGNTKSQCQS